MGLVRRSGTDQSTVRLADHDGRRAGPGGGAACAIACVARPMADELCRIRYVGLGDRLAGMLDVDEDGLAVGRFGAAGNFAIYRPDQKATKCFCRRLRAHTGLHRQCAAVGFGVGQRRRGAVTHAAGQADQHHAVGDVGVSTVVGLDEGKTCLWAKPQAIGAGKVLVIGQ